MKTISQILSAELNQPEAYIQNVIALLDEGNNTTAIIDVTQLTERN